MVSIRKFLRYVPGFRTFTVWKMVLAGLYYLMSVLLLTSGFGYLLTSLALPFIIFGIVDVVKNKKKGAPAGKSLATVLVALLVFIAGSALAPETSAPQQMAQDREASPVPVSPEQSADREKARVVKVIDGDTFEIEGGTTVRLIGVDTPESVHPDQSRNVAFGKTASDFTKERLEGKAVYLEKDVSETDRYGRLLRYVYLEDGTFFNELLVKEGMANPATFPPDVRHSDVFVKAQQYAESNNKGLWAVAEQEDNAVRSPAAAPGAGKVSKPAAKPDTKPVSEADKAPESDNRPGPSEAGGKGLIKGNINSKGEKIYHVPGGQYYDRTIAEEWFKTEKDAVAAGYRKSKR